MRLPVAPSRDARLAGHRFRMVESGHNSSLRRTSLTATRSPSGTTVEGSAMHRLPARFPAETKYVLEARGPWVHRYIEFPDGRKIELSPRKALACKCVAAAPAENRRRRLAEAAA